MPIYGCYLKTYLELIISGAIYYWDLITCTNAFWYFCIKVRDLSPWTKPKSFVDLSKLWIFSRALDSNFWTKLEKQFPMDKHYKTI